MKRLRMFRLGIEFGFAPKKTDGPKRWKLVLNFWRWSKTWGSA